MSFMETKVFTSFEMPKWKHCATTTKLLGHPSPTPIIGFAMLPSFYVAPA